MPPLHSYAGITHDHAAIIAALLAEYDSTLNSHYFIQYILLPLLFIRQLKRMAKDNWLI